MADYFDSETLGFIRDYGYSLSPSMQSNVNHENCPAGKDTKNRLYVKVTDDGKMTLGYCHHCGQRGGVRRAAFAVPNPATGWLTTHQVDSLNDRFHDAEAVYEDCKLIVDSRFVDFEATAQVTGLKYVINPKNDQDYQRLFWLRDSYGIKLYGDHKLGLMLPITSGEGIVGYTYRYYHDGAGSGTWLTASKYDASGKALGTGPILYNYSGSKTVVICEDVLSAIKCDMSGYAGLAVRGNTLKTETALKIASIFDRAHVWLDNDSALIKANALEARSKLGLFMGGVSSTLTKGDPKLHSVDEIQNEVK